MSEEKVSVVGEPTLETEITEELAASEEIKDESVPQSEVPAPAIDLSNLNTEQLQALKAALSATPDRSSTANQAKTVKIRRYQDKYVVDFKQAYPALIMDETLQRKVEQHIIPIKLEGAEDFINVPYRTFMQSEQVPCKVLAMPKEEHPIVEGETYDEHDRLVEMVRTEVVYSLKIETPEGRELNVEGKIANA